MIALPTYTPAANVSSRTTSARTQSPHSIERGYEPPLLRSPFNSIFAIAGLALLTLRGLTCASDWPQWRGPLRTGHAPENTAAPSSLPPDLKPVWKIPAGGGFAAPVVAGETLIMFAEDGQTEIVQALNATTGKELWRTPIAPRFEDEWGAGPRSTPIIDGARVYAVACNGEFRCLNLSDGKVVWATSFEKDFGAKFLGSKANEGTASRRGNNGSGVIDGNRLVLPVGGTPGSSLVCFDKATGKVFWKSGDDEAAYSSLMVGTLAGVRQVVAFNADALLGAELSSGRILWRVPLKTNAKRHASTPVIFGNRVAVNSHTFGMVCIEISKAGDGLQAAQAWINADLKINLATPVLVDGYLYCQGANKDFVCVEAATGQLKWSKSGYGLGRRDYASTIALGNKLLVLAEDGQLVLLEANPSQYKEISRIQVCGSTWAFPAYANGRLYVRDGRELSCYNLASKESLP